MQFQFDNFTLDTERFQLMCDGEAVRTEPQVMELLIFLIVNRGRMVSRIELNDSIWNGRVVSDSALSSRIKIARQALGDNGRKQQYIRTIHKKGFTFSSDVTVKETTDITPEKHDALATIQTPESMLADRKPSIAVITFTNLGSDPEKQFISDGITEDIITALSKISKLMTMVYPTSSNEEETITDKLRIAGKLNIDYLLEGSVRSEGEKLRISSRLIEVSSAQHRWAQRYDRNNSDIFELQDNITKEVVSALQVELTEGDQALLASRGTENIKAWQLTYEAVVLVLAHRQDAVRRGIELLEEALRLDDSYALAWNTLSTGHWKEYMNIGWSNSRQQSLDNAIECSDKALTLGPRNARSLATRSLIVISPRKFDEAFDLAVKALEFANSDANSIAIAAITLRYCCKPEMSIKYTQKAMRLCPIYPAWYPYGLALCNWMLGNFDDAFKNIEEAIGIDPGLSLNYIVLAMLYTETDQPQKAMECVERIYQADPSFSATTFIDSVPFSNPEVEKRRTGLFRKVGLLD
ncbi:MAG: TolB-like protein [Parasphingorhabdus sp.]|jgi:TolB-like protein